MIKKIHLHGPQARKKLLKGALEVGKLVGSTLGPSGRNCIIQVQYSAPQVTNDGVSIARNICLDDPIEDLGAQVVVEACMKTNERAGDGTTTTAVVACKIMEECAKKIEEDEDEDLRTKADVIGMSKAILDGRDVAIAKLKELAKPVKKGDIRNIINTSLGKLYPQYVETVTEILEVTGKDGYVDVEDNFATKYGLEYEMTEGMRFMGSFATPFMVTNAEKMEAVMNNPIILVTNWRISSYNDLTPLLTKLNNELKTGLIVISEGYEKRAVEGFNKTIVKGVAKGVNMTNHLLAIKAPSLTTDQFHDIAIACGARFIDKNSGESLEYVESKDLGSAKKIIIDENNTVIMGGKGANQDPITKKKVTIADRIKLLKEQAGNEKDMSFKKQTERRIASLASGFATIRVGAATEQEQSYIRYKIEDAVNAAKAAMEEGIVPGGGLALVTVAEALGKDHILYTALCAPHEKIKENVGGSIKIPATIVDPVKVSRLAIENACSVSAQLITAESAIANEKKTLWGEMEKKIAPRDDSDDFRDDDNQDKPYRS